MRRNQGKQLENYKKNNMLDNIGHQLTTNYYYDEDDQFQLYKIKHQKVEADYEMSDDFSILKILEDQSVLADQLKDEVSGLEDLSKNILERSGVSSNSSDFMAISENIANNKQKKQPNQSSFMSENGLVVSRHNTDTPNSVSLGIFKNNQTFIRSPPGRKASENCGSLQKFTRKISRMPEKQDLKTLVGKQLEGDAKIIHQGKIIKTKFMFCKNLLAFIEVSFQFDEIEKVKIMFDSNSKQNWLKIQTDSAPHLFSIGHSSNKNIGIQLPFYVFSNIINKRISLQGVLSQFKQEVTVHKHIQQEFTFNSRIYGCIYKKSQFIGKWFSRFIVIKHNGIYSYRNPHLNEEHSFYIPQDSIKYIWTRFETIYDTHLIVKIKHGIHKTQLAIPVIDFTVNHNNWLYQLYKLLL